MKSNSITNFYFKLHIFVLALIKDLALTELSATLNYADISMTWQHTQLSIISKL